MGLRSVLSSTGSAARQGGKAPLRGRFAKYFPRLFAYVQSALRDEARARDVVADVFAAVFERHAGSSEDEFRIWLFAEARHALQACSPGPGSDGLSSDLVGDRTGPSDEGTCTACSPGPGSDGLSSRERDVVSLLFDAQLTRREVASVLCVSDDTVSATLLKALRKLRDVTTPQSAWVLRTT